MFKNMQKGRMAADYEPQRQKKTRQVWHNGKEPKKNNKIAPAWNGREHDGRRHWGGQSVVATCVTGPLPGLKDTVFFTNSAVVTDNLRPPDLGRFSMIPFSENSMISSQKNNVNSSAFLVTLPLLGIKNESAEAIQQGIVSRKETANP